MKKDKSFLIWNSICFSCLFLIGVILGSCFSLTQTNFSFEKAAFKGPVYLSDKAADVFLDFLFNNVLYLLLIFLFGLTFLGILLIPGLILLKGFVQGIAFTIAFVTGDLLTYVQIWTLYLTEIVCTIFLFFFAAYAFGLSVKFYRQLFQSGDFHVCWQKYGVRFILTFIITVVSGGIHTLTVYVVNIFL